MQVVEGWGIEGLDGATATRLYTKARDQLGVAQPPPELSSSYTPEYFQANTDNGVSVVAPPTIPVVRFDICATHWHAVFPFLFPC